MSEEDVVDPRHESQILAALEALEEGSSAVDDESRAYLEALGLLAYELDEVPPTASAERALMAEIERRAARPTGAAGTAPATPPVRPSWALRIAAVLAVALLGVSSWQFVELGEQRRQIRRQEARIAELQQRVELLAQRAAETPAWLVSSGTELCPLKPRDAAGPASKGWLFIRQDHQHWYVAFEGLGAAPEGHVYEVWFRTDGRLVSGGTFAPDQEGRATLASPSMPSHVTGIAVTLEPDNGDDVPSEAMVLYGDEVTMTL